MFQNREGELGLSLGYIDIPIDLNDINASAEDFFLNLGVFGGMDDRFARINTSTFAFGVKRSVQ